MDYKKKYLKYKQKYLKLKGGRLCDICPTKGFNQHSGECWHDAFSMVMLFTDDLSDNIQNLFNIWLQNESLIDEYFVKTFLDESRKILLPPNIYDLSDELKDIIKTYIISLYERYKNEIQKNKYLILEQEKRRLIRTHSMSMSLQCVNYSFELAKINHIYKEKYDNKNLGGQTGYIYIIKSILNYIFSDNPNNNINMTEIGIHKFNFNKTFIKHMIGISNCILINIHLNNSGHVISCFKCNDKFYIYDDNRGEEYANEVIYSETDADRLNKSDIDQNTVYSYARSIQEFDWKSHLLQIFESDNNDEINDNLKLFVKRFGTYISTYNVTIESIVFFYPKNLSLEYYYDISLHINYSNEKSLKFWEQRLNYIIDNDIPIYVNILGLIKYIIIQLDTNVRNNDAFKNTVKHILIILLNKISERRIDINETDILHISIDMSLDNNFIKQLLSIPNINVNKPNFKSVYPIVYAITTENKEIIDLIINKSDFNINQQYIFGSILHALSDYESLQDIFKDLVENKRIDIFIVDQDNLTVIELMALNNNQNMFDYLYDYIIKNYDINIFNKKSYEQFILNINDDLDKTEEEKQYYINKIKTFVINLQ